MILFIVSYIIKCVIYIQNDIFNKYTSDVIFNELPNHDPHANDHKQKLSDLIVRKLNVVGSKL